MANVEHRRSRCRLGKLLTAIFAAVFAFSLSQSFSTFAAANIFRIQNVTLSEISTDAEGTVSSFTDDSIISNITFHHLNDLAKYTITFKNTDSNPHTIEAITNDNDNPYITYEHDSFAETTIEAGDSFNLIVTAKYTTAADINARVQSTDVKFKIKLVGIDDPDVVPLAPDTSGNTNQAVITAVRNNSILIITSVIGFTICIIFVAKRHKKAAKVVAVLALAVSAAAITTSTKAATKTETPSIKATYTLEDRLVVTWTDADDSTHTEIINYNGTLNLPAPTIAEGEKFTGWYNQAEGGEKVDLTEPVESDFSVFAHTRELATTAEWYTGSLIAQIIKNINPYITTFRHYTTDPQPDDNYPSDKYKDLAAPSSEGRIYIWQDDDDENIINWWTEASTIHLNHQYSNDMFNGLSRLKNIDLSGIDFSTAPTLAYFFSGTAITSIDLSSWDTSSNRSLSGMFSQCGSLTSVTFGNNFNTENVTNMNNLFDGASSLTSVDLSMFDTRKVTGMQMMFRSTTMETLDLSSFETPALRNIKMMFAMNSNLKTIYVSEGFNTDNVVSGGGTQQNSNDYEVFQNTTSLVGGAGTAFNSSNPTHKTYARIDDPTNDKPGYFTLKAARIIHYDGNYPDGGSMSDDYYTRSGKLKKNAYTAIGYHFAGWSLEMDGEKVYDDEEPMRNIPNSDEPLTLYVIWEPNAYTFVFYKNSEQATGSMEPYKAEYDGYRTHLPRNEFVLEEYRFIGWKEDNQGDLIQDGANVSHLTVEDGTTINLYAQWEVLPVGIDYYKNSSEAVGTTQRSEGFGRTTNLNTPNFHRDGYGFAGWNTKEDGTGTMYGPNERVTISDDGLKLYAIWVKAEEGITMQTFDDTTEPYASYPVNKVIALKDDRDNQVYTVAKLPDGKWWMTENLRLVPTGVQLTSENTNNPTAAVKNITSTGEMCTENTAECINRFIFRSDQLNASGSNPVFAYGNGVYYNVYAATAGHAAVDLENPVTEQVAGDICPKGWHLPVSGVSGDFRTLDISLGSNGYNTLGDYEFAQKYFKAPINLVTAGWRENTAAYRNIGTEAMYLESGTDGLVHSSNSFTDASATIVDQTTNKYDAYTIRCIAY